MMQITTSQTRAHLIDNKRFKWLIVIIPGLFAATFLNLFQPFSISNPDLDPVYILTLAGYGLQGSLIIYFHEFILRSKLRIFNKTELKRATVVGWYLWILLLIAAGNFLYHNLVERALLDRGDYLFTYHKFFQFIYRTAIISAIPATGLYLYFKYRELRETPAEIDNLKEEVADHITLLGDNKSDLVRIDPALLLFIQSKGNYALIFYLNENNEIEKHLIRASLRKLEEQLSGTAATRCHQSFIVNTSMIMDVKGNSRGMKLYLKNTLFEVPVSRNYIPGVKRRTRSS